MRANLENSAVAKQGWKSSVFISIPKKGNPFLGIAQTTKECSDYHIIAVISHISKVISKFSKPGFNGT